MPSMLVCVTAWAVVSVGLGCAGFVGAKTRPLASGFAVAFLWLPILALVCVIGVVAIVALPVWAVYAWLRARRGA